MPLMLTVVCMGNLSKAVRFVLIGLNVDLSQDGIDLMADVPVMETEMEMDVEGLNLLVEVDQTMIVNVIAQLNVMHQLIVHRVTALHVPHVLHVIFLLLKLHVLALILPPLCDPPKCPTLRASKFPFPPTF